MKSIQPIYVRSFLVTAVNFKDEYEEGDIAEKNVFAMIATFITRNSH